MDNFDFRHVAEVFDRMGYTWYNNGKPCEQDIRREARKRLRVAADHQCSTNTGRLMATYHEGTDADGPWLKLGLHFIPESWEEDGTSCNP